MSKKNSTSIVVFIASSRTGRCLVLEGLEAGYQVRAAVRSETKFRSLVSQDVLTNSNLSIHQCDPDSVEDIIPVLRGTSITFLATGGTEIEKAAYMNQDLTVTILAALDHIEPSDRPSRFVLLSAEPVHPQSKRDAPWMNWLMTENLMWPIYHDLQQTQKILHKHRQKISYTFVQPGALLDSPSTNSTITLVDFQANRLLTYPDLAKGMLMAAFDESCENGKRGVHCAVEPRLSWSGMKTPRDTFGMIFNLWVVRPGLKIVALVAVGYLLKSKVFRNYSFRIGGYHF